MVDSCLQIPPFEDGENPKVYA
jgi:hypothetical protein